MFPVGRSVSDRWESTGKGRVSRVPSELSLEQLVSPYVPDVQLGSIVHPLASNVDVPAAQPFPIALHCALLFHPEILRTPLEVGFDDC